MRVGAIGPKLDGHGTEDAELARHLVHPTQSSLFICVCKLDHQTGRGTLQGHDSTQHKVSERSPLLVSGFILFIFFRDGDGFFLMLFSIYIFISNRTLAVYYCDLVQII